jgi:hypothetical protein
MDYCVLDSGGAKERGLLIGRGGPSKGLYHLQETSWSRSTRSSEQIIIYWTILLGFRSVVNFLYRSPSYIKQRIFGTLDDPLALIDTRRAESSKNHGPVADWACQSPQTSKEAVAQCIEAEYIAQMTIEYPIIVDQDTFASTKFTWDRNAIIFAHETVRGGGKVQVK